MLESAHIIGVLLALGSAAVWGTGDFAGGVAAKRLNQYQVLVVSGISGLVILIAVSLISRQGVPGQQSMLWAIGAGGLGGLGLATLYKGLAEGHAAIVAPTAAVVGASLPVLVGFLLEGLLQPQQIAGMLLALLGIWLVSREHESAKGNSRESVMIGALAGCGFAGFLIMIAQVDSETMMTSLTVARLSTLLVALGLCYRAGLKIPNLRHNKLALYAGVADVTGNILYVTAQQYTRLDVAAVLSSLYPATTVLLAWTILKQKMSFAQWAGVLCCLGGVGFIAA